MLNSQLEKSKLNKKEKISFIHHDRIIIHHYGKKVDFNLKREIKRSKSLPAGFSDPRKRVKKIKLARSVSLTNEISRNLNRKSIQHAGKKSNQKSSSALGKSSFVAFNEACIHQHDHRKTPHMHTTECDRHVSGLDKNRCTRFYFTKQTTPVRVYLSYNEKLIMASLTDMKDTKHLPLNSSFNGRKLSPKTLKSQFKLSPKFIEDAKNLIFLKDSLSFVPPININDYKLNEYPNKTSHILGNRGSFLSVKYKPVRRATQLSSSNTKNTKASVISSDKSKDEWITLNQ